MDIAQMRMRRLRVAIQNNQVSFPSQVPTFPRQSRPFVQWRVVELYFVNNWSCADLAERYGVSPSRVRQMLSNWVKQAIVLGYMQEIPAWTSLTVKTVAPRETGLAGIQAGIAATLLSDQPLHLVGSSKGSSRPLDHYLPATP
jgi:hypothetical protein